MYLKKILLLLIIGVSCSFMANAQARKIDTTMKVGKSGYRVLTNNKNAEKNNVTITPIGFENGSQDATIEIKGRLRKAEVDDLNNDGFPDLVLYVYNGEGGAYGTVFGVLSEKNEGMRPILFPDLMDDLKLKIGYKGHDEFVLIEGTLLRRFPVYKAVDSTSTNMQPTGITRQIQYRVQSGGEGGISKFKVIRNYETNKQ